MDEGETTAFGGPWLINESIYPVSCRKALAVIVFHISLLYVLIMTWADVLSPWHFFFFNECYFNTFLSLLNNFVYRETAFRTLLNKHADNIAGKWFIVQAEVCAILLLDSSILR